MKNCRGFRGLNRTLRKIDRNHKSVPEGIGKQTACFLAPLISIFRAVSDLLRPLITAHYDRSVPENSFGHDNLRRKVTGHANDFAGPQARSSPRGL